MKPDVLLRVLQEAGATMDGGEAKQQKDQITKQDLFALGLSGGENSMQRRVQLMQYLNLPTRMSANAMLDALNVLMDRAALENCCAELFVQTK